jgi:hypothetical protein
MMTKDAIGDPSFVLHGNERGTMIKGVPGVIEMAKQLVAQGERRAREARACTASSVHHQMQDVARQSPGWEGMADGITMAEHPDGSYVFGFDPERADAMRATEMEFGTPGHRPESVYRKVLIGRRPMIERELNQRLR